MMRRKSLFHRSSALLLSLTMTAGVLPAVSYAADADFAAYSLTLQPGANETEVNLTWYAKGTTESVHAQVKFNGTIVEAAETETTMPTSGTNPYADYVVCTATVQNLTHATDYTYQVSEDSGTTWSQEYQYTTPAENAFTFAFTSDPQINANNTSDSKGWNSSDGTNQTGWATMMQTISNAGASLIVSAGDQVEDQSWGKQSEYDAFFAPEEMTSIAYAPAVGNHDRHYMFGDHFNLPNEMATSVEATENANTLTQVKTTFRGQNSGTSASHGNYIEATADEIANSTAQKDITPNTDGIYDYTERREMETEGNYYYLYDNVLFVTLNTGAYAGGNDTENGVETDNSEAEALVANYKKTMTAATTEYDGQYNWLVVTHHKSTETVAKHAADSDIENYVDAGFETLMTEFNVDFVLGGHDHVYSRSYVLASTEQDGSYVTERTEERLNTYNDPQGTIYLTGNCCSDMQYYTPFEKLDKNNNADYPVLANGLTGSENYLLGQSAANPADYLPYGNQEFNQEYSPSYALFDVSGDTISVKVYNLSGDSENPDSEQVDTFSVTKNASNKAKISGQENETAQLTITETAQFTSGQSNADGGVMEIVSYNTVTGWAYAINGQSGVLTAIAIKELEASENMQALNGNDIDITKLVESADSDFTYGDMTSIAVSPDGSELAVAIQAEDYAANGKIARFTCNTDGTLTLMSLTEAGVQPDMVTFTPDGTKVLTANEGEPRHGYGTGTTDPAGSVTILSVAEGTAQTIGFEPYNTVEARKALADAGIVLKKDTAPSVDFEPEYITTSDSTAYITLQEANAVAVLDLTSGTYTGVYSVGYEDYAKTAVDINAGDGTYAPSTYENLLGIRMPDAVSMYTVNGTDYILTANEGDSRAWGDEEGENSNEYKNKTSPSGNIKQDKKVTWFDTTYYDGLQSGVDYLFGGRSFTLFRVTDTGLEEVFDSGSDAEAKTAAYLPNYFNCSNDDTEIDSRSGKKGPEVETVTTGTVGERKYAFVTLERIGGVMVYDITDPANVSYVNYINSRDFSTELGADDSPEGLCFVSAKNSPTDSALLMAACEVGGTVAVYELNAQQTSPSDPSDPVQPEQKLFADDNSSYNWSWASKSIYACANKGILVGYEDNTFRAENNLTRAEAAALIARASNLNTEAATTDKLSDIAGHWGEKYIAACVNTGIIIGYEDSTFRPDTSISRAEFAKMLVCASDMQNGSTENTFADVSGHWAEDFIKTIASNGIVDGYEDGTFRPDNKITRAEAAKVIAGTYHLI